MWRCAPSHPLRFPSRRSCSRRKRHSVALPMSFDRNVTNALISTDKEFDENAHSSTPYRFSWIEILLIHLCLLTFDCINSLKHLKWKWKNQLMTRMPQLKKYPTLFFGKKKRVGNFSWAVRQSEGLTQLFLSGDPRQMLTLAAGARKPN